MIRLVLCLACAALASGCGSPTKTTTIHRPDLTSGDYNRYVSRRSEQLQQMGGPFKDDPLAAQMKAQQEANARYGNVPSDYSTTWRWGNEARKAAADAEFKEKYSRVP